MTSTGPRRWAATLLLVLVAATETLSAHDRGGQAQGFLTGFLHPLSGPDHVAAMIAVGLWGAQLGAPAMWLLPITFPMVMAVGGFLALIGAPVPAIELGIAISAVVLGVAVALEMKPPLAVAAIVVGVFAVFHGYAHGAELPPGQDGLTYSIGFVIATGCLHAAGIVLGLAYRWPWGRHAMRLAGMTVAVAGCFFLWRAVP